MPFNITIDHATTSHGSDHSSLTDEEDSSGTGVQVSPPSATGSHGYDYDDGADWAHLQYPDELKPSDSSSRSRGSGRHRNPIQPSRSGGSHRHPPRRQMPRERDPPSHRPRRQRAASPSSEESGDDYDYAPPPPPQDRRYWHPNAHPGYAHSSSSGPSYGHYPHGEAPPRPGYPHSGDAMSPSNQLVQFGQPHPGPYGGPSPYGYGLPYPQGPGHPVPPGYFDPELHPHGRHHEPLPHPRQLEHLDHIDHLDHLPPHHPAHAAHPHRPHRSHHSHHPHHPRHSPTQSRGRGERDSPPQPALAHPIPPHATPPFGGAPFSPQDMVPYAPHSGYFPYNPAYPGHHGMVPPHYFNPYQRPPSPDQTPSTPPPPEPPAPSAADIAKDEAIARLEKLIIDERADREAKEAAREAAIAKEAADKIAREERAAADKKIAEEAAAQATAIAKAEAEERAAEAAAKAKQEAEEAAAAARKEAEEAAAAAAAEAAAAAAEAANAATAEAVAAAAAEATAAATKPPPPEKKKPIKFKDAVGRKFSFPFHLCNTWAGMEELIRQAFLHVEVIGPHVAEGHYDLVGPNGDIILPQVWETVVEPDWTITMHMWPIPEKPKDPEPPPPEDDAAVITVIEPKKKGDAPGAPPPPPPPPGDAADGAAQPPSDGTGEEVIVVNPPPAPPKKPRPREVNPGAFAMWMVGNRKPAKALKVEKKPEVVQQQDDCCVM
ncbi:hypothetical protein FQN54_000648 [Arachnomyces sp. PD_36]|nr:hypothetical protein FQN54_000648 [Arachnomyces sp. PD_36]